MTPQHLRTDGLYRCTEPMPRKGEALHNFRKVCGRPAKWHILDGVHILRGSIYRGGRRYGHIDAVRSVFICEKHMRYYRAKRKQRIEDVYVQLAEKALE
jgi:hypothetical protein